MRITVKNLTKKFGPLAVVSNVTLAIEEGELFTLLGPSGCGKTTLLRLIAGFYAPDEGDVFFNERRVNDVPPHERRIGMVFQNYALWPHMTVWDNVAYGLKLRKVPQAEISERVQSVLNKVKLGGYEQRYPGQLSGGQQQRVALARALARPCHSASSDHGRSGQVAHHSFRSPPQPLVKRDSDQNQTARRKGLPVIIDPGRNRQAGAEHANDHRADNRPGNGPAPTKK